MLSKKEWKRSFYAIFKQAIPSNRQQRQETCHLALMKHGRHLTPAEAVEDLIHCDDVAGYIIRGMQTLEREETDQHEALNKS